MRPFLLSALLFVLTHASFAQEQETETYLVVRIPKQSDKSNAYFTIEADLHNDNALGLYELVPFNKTLFVPKKGVHFYYNRPDTAAQYYNYFKSESEALDFIGRQQWQLVNVLSEITSGYQRDGLSGPPYTTVSSRPVYYFRKKVTPLDAVGQ